MQKRGQGAAAGCESVCVVHNGSSHLRPTGPHPHPAAPMRTHVTSPTAQLNPLVTCACHVMPAAVQQAPDGLQCT